MCQQATGEAVAEEEIRDAATEGASFMRRALLRVPPSAMINFFDGAPGSLTARASRKGRALSEVRRLRLEPVLILPLRRRAALRAVAGLLVFLCLLSGHLRGCGRRL